MIIYYIYMASTFLTDRLISLNFSTSPYENNLSKINYIEDVKNINFFNNNIVKLL